MGKACHVCFQASLHEHRVIESKPDNTVEDLRFHQPWPELQRFADSIDLASADDITHKHVPYGECGSCPSAAAHNVMLAINGSCCLLCLRPCGSGLQCGTTYRCMNKSNLVVVCTLLEVI